MNAPWSYSSMSTFKQCPKKYYHTRVAKDFMDVGGEAANYGTDVHKVAEDYIALGTPVPKKYAYLAPIVEKAQGLPGTKYAELKLGVSKIGGDYYPCDFTSPDAWWRGIIDLLSVAENKAFVIDWKTGKSARYADVKQLDLMAGAIFTHFPDVEVIKSGLAFVVSNEWVPKTHVRAELHEYMSVFDEQLEQLEHAHASGVWNPQSSGLCGWCPVVSCAHHRPRR